VKKTTLAVALATAGVLCVAAPAAGPWFGTMPVPVAAAAANPPCTKTLTLGAIEDEANRLPYRVLCLATAYYQEPRDALIVITQHDVRIQAAPGAYPIVCGRFVLRGAQTSVAPDVRLDAACATYFNERSPWNKVAATYGSPVPIPSTWLPDFDSTNGTRPLDLANSWDHGKAIFKATSFNPMDATFRIADSTQCFDDPAGCAVWQPTDPTHRVADQTAANPDRIPIPPSVRCPGLPTVDNEHDRALSVISADGRTAWEFWHCTHAATFQEPWYTAGVAAKWNLDPDDPTNSSLGYQDEGLGKTGSTSARGSGTPLVTTTITPREAVRGIQHPLGLTVLTVTDAYVNPPASHTDGCSSCARLRYGMLFVLRSNFRPAQAPTIGELNIIDALKRYGAYVVDQGPAFELDGSPNEPTEPAISGALWAQAGVNLRAIGIRPSDLRYVPTPGSPPAVP
jgi:hypothetical protein